jgi:hypothetical protein
MFPEIAVSHGCHICPLVTLGAVHIFQYSFNTANILPSSVSLFALMIEAIRSFETFVRTRATRRHILKYSILHRLVHGYHLKNYWFRFEHSVGSRSLDHDVVGHKMFRKVSPVEA